MRKERFGKWAILPLFAVLITIASAGTAFAQTSTSNSNNYQMIEAQFGTTDESCSSQYCSKTSIGDLSNGSEARTSSASFEDIVDNEPRLDVSIGASVSNLGMLTTEKTASKTVSIQIRNYLTGGYTLQITGDPPKFDGHTLKTPGVPTASAAGTEQFAINAVANTTPGIGADPVQVPGGQGNFGVVQAGYNTPNLYKYVSGDVVARGVADSGRTNYTLSMIVNIANGTPAGHYSGDFMAVVIPAF